MSTVTVIQKGESTSFLAEKQENLLLFLRENGIFVDAPCGGHGRCGKCRVLLRDGGGERRVNACQTYIEGDCTVVLPQGSTTVCLVANERHGGTGQPGFGAAVDLGTTTVAMQLCDLSTGAVLAAAGERNAQCAYGADVVTRLSYVREYPTGNERLSGLLTGQITRMLEELCEKAGLAPQSVTEITVAGNTIMQHFLSGLSPAAMAVAPFTAVTLFEEDTLYRRPGLPALHLAPCVSAYVGGDIVAGLYACGGGVTEETTLFLDIGTNGEMALGNREGFLCCAVACGPAFEGAEITCGMACEEGALTHVRWEKGSFVMETVGQVPLRGICGSGLIDLLAVLLRLGGVDEGGRLLPPEEAPGSLGRWLEEDKNGNGILYLNEERTVYLTAGDVRKMQLAKAAVAAGITILLEKAGKTVEAVDRVCLAGGFGSRIAPESAAAVGMLPPALTAKIQGVGNASLSGAAAMLLIPAARSDMERIQRNSRYCELSGDRAFQEAFVNYMMFENEEESL